MTGAFFLVRSISAIRVKSTSPQVQYISLRTDRVSLVPRHQTMKAVESSSQLAVPLRVKHSPLKAPKRTVNCLYISYLCRPIRYRVCMNACVTWAHLPASCIKLAHKAPMHLARLNRVTLGYFDGVKSEATFSWKNPGRSKGFSIF
jgi:hypothetical protein